MTDTAPGSDSGTAPPAPPWVLRRSEDRMAHANAVVMRSSTFSVRLQLTFAVGYVGQQRERGAPGCPGTPRQMERATGIEPATSSLGISSRSPNFMSLAIRTHHLRPSFGPPDLTPCHSFSRHLGIILGSGRWAPRQPESLPWNVTAKPGCRSRPGSSVCIPIRPIGVQPLLCQGPAVSTAAWGSPLNAVVSEPRAHLQGGCSLLRPPLEQARCEPASAGGALHWRRALL